VKVGLTPQRSGDCPPLLRVSAEAARAAAAAALGTAVVTMVVGYTTRKMHAAGGASVRLLLPEGVGVWITCRECSVVTLRAPGQMAFLPGLAAPFCVGRAPVALEVIVLARPDESYREVTQLPEEHLRNLFPEASKVDLRVVRPLLPFEPGSAEWLQNRLVQLAELFDEHFGMPCPPYGSQTAYEGCELNAHELSDWLADAGISVGRPRSAWLDADTDAVQLGDLGRGNSREVEDTF